MPFIPHTPESLLPRSDSKNSATTCNGLTNNGRPCRRAISRSPQSSPGSSPQRLNQTIAYCWQHQDQGKDDIEASPQSIGHSTIRERTSVDTLIDRLGLIEVEAKKPQRRQHRRPVPENRPEKNPHAQNSHRETKSKPRPTKTSNLALLCCIGVADDSNRVSRPAKPVYNTKPIARVPAQQDYKIPQGAQMRETQPRPPINRDLSSRTGKLLSLIPSSASPQMTALLLAELAKPVSDADDAGYIYMFWLTPLDAQPPLDIASSLLAPPSRPQPGRRRTSDVLDSIAKRRSDKTNQKTILLKIGRAQNVQRRLNQWTRQCGYNVSLIRYYPYHPTTPSDANLDALPRTPRQVPNAHKVERLIHIELSERKSQESGKCTACGREHREWFEVEASRAGVKAVDEIIRRWVGWAERDFRR